jgi:Ca-activated chloride channel homolog
MIKFASIQYLYFLCAVPALIALYAWSFRRRRMSLETFAAPALAERLSASSMPGRSAARAIIVISVVTILIVAAARPQIGTKIETVKRKGIDIVIAIDTSKSMNAEDALGASRVRRIDKAKHEVEALLEMIKNDRIGLVAFAGIAHVQCPLTADYDAAKIFLDVIDTDLIPTPGTAIGKAIEQSTKLFDENEKKYKAIILITDGEDLAGDPVEAAKEAKKQGIKIFPIGIGSPQGAPVPEYDRSGNKIGFKKDSGGRMVMSELNEVALEKISLVTGGKYFPASVGELELNKIYSEISSMEKKELSSRKYTHFEDRFQWPLGLALALLAIEAFITTRTPARRRKKR